MPITGFEFCEALKRRDYRFYAGVPCSYFTGVIANALAQPELTYVSAANEGAALAVAAGAAEAGEKPVVLLQNSGFGNLVNPLTSLSLIYRIPSLLFISLRAFGDEEDEPQHRIIGATLTQLLTAFDIPFHKLPGSLGDFESILAEADATVAQGGVAAILIPKGAIDGECDGSGDTPSYPLSRIGAIRLVAQQLEPNTAIVATTGKISRELFATMDRAGNFYMQGSMGHAAAIGLGVALAGKPSSRVVVLDGDGAALMHMGTLSTVGHFSPANLLHVVLDNEAYGTTGNQPTTSATARLAEIALACGYRQAAECRNATELAAAIDSSREGGGPSCVVVKINRDEPHSVPRVTSKYSPLETARRFAGFLHDA